jgi:hypothetical protein
VNNDEMIDYLNDYEKLEMQRYRASLEARTLKLTNDKAELLHDKKAFRERLEKRMQEIIGPHAVETDQQRRMRLLNTMVNGRTEVEREIAREEYLTMERGKQASDMADSITKAYRASFPRPGVTVVPNRVAPPLHPTIAGAVREYTPEEAEEMAYSVMKAYREAYPGVFEIIAHQQAKYIPEPPTAAELLDGPRPVKDTPQDGPQ